MAELPSGTVTFVFTDLAISTRLWDTEPDAMQVAQARHDSMVREKVSAHGGVVVKGRGDGVHAVFATADAAVRASVDLERAMVAEDWSLSEPLRVRIGIHTGTAQLRDGDYFGSDVNRAARLEAIGHGGQIVCSQATADLARNLEADGISFVDLGEHRLRDLMRAERVFQVRAPGLPAEFPPLRSLDAFGGNLPVQLSSFIGRDRELVKVADALDAARVVTLTGVGGVGKTRLAYEVAADQLPKFREGAWLVELAAVRDPAEVMAAVSGVFGVTPRSGQSAEVALVEFLRAKHLLLVVDNCEHLLGAVAALVEMLERSCSGLSVLATSREGLGVEGERILVVPSLDMASGATDLDSVAAADAVRLFVARATAAKADFVLTERNAEAVAQICLHLDGVPLAIELAAARVPAMSPAVLASRLDQRFRVLSGGRRGAVERHQTLQAAIDWSYDLCTQSEQWLLARLAVFTGGWSLDAAEAVCSTEGIEAEGVFELLATLVARHLVVADDTEGGDVRYRLLETIRQYAEERLVERDEHDLLRGRHAEYFCEYARDISEQLSGPTQIETARRFSAEHENLVAALNNAIDSDDADLALRLVCSMPESLFQIGRVLYLPTEHVVDLTGASEHPLYPEVLAYRATSELFGDSDAAHALMHQAREASRRLGTDTRHIEVLGSREEAYGFIAVGALGDAGAAFEWCAALARAAGKRGVAAFDLGSAAFEYMLAGDDTNAGRVGSEGLALAREIDMPTAIVCNLHAIAGSLVDEDRDQAITLFREAVKLRRALGYETASETQQAVILGARLGLLAETLEAASSALRLYSFTTDWANLGGLCNMIAHAIALTDPTAAATIQGIAYYFATKAAATSNQAAQAASTRAAPARDPAARNERVGLVTKMRRDTTGVLIEALGDASLHELRNDGRALDTDRAIAYTVDALERARSQPSLAANE